MYEIRPETIRTFIEDNSIKLPRFQRKQVWNSKKNFELCISIFKEFPMGVCILNVENDQGKTTKWLLDGRQRRNALKQMWEDPENIYQWAKKWAGFKATAQSHEVEEKFWERINIYLEEDGSESSETAVSVSDSNEDDAATEELTGDMEERGSEQPEPDTTIDLTNTTIDLTRNSLQFLLDIILLVHNKTTRSSGFTRPFDFSKTIGSLPYDVPVKGKTSLNSRKLKTFIYEYKAAASDDDLEFDQPSTFKAFMEQRFDLKNPELTAVHKTIDTNWLKILDQIRMLDKIQDLITQAKIGLIEVKEISATDSQKIFNIINSQGTPLTAVEVLSAKRSWNQEIKQPTPDQVDAKDTLYREIEIKHDGIVKWDLPATLLRRLQNFENFIALPADPSAALDKQLTLGFKLISGIFEKGVRKENIDRLGSNLAINWERDFEKTVANLNLMTKLIMETEYFKYFKSWQASITGLLSDAIALNFVLLMYEDWKRKGEPVGSDTRAKQFQKNSLVLLDRLMFEYVYRGWRGSSDSKIASNLANFVSQPTVFEPVAKAKWKALLTEIFQSHSIDNVKITQKVMTPLLYHFYCLRKVQGPASNFALEVDHILPQSVFNASTILGKDYIQHNLFNLGLLPKDENCSKGSDRLKNIDKQWLKDQVVRYESIPEKDFDKFSDLKNWEQLRKLRSPIFLSAFGAERDTILAN